jgi:hypothetical protein
LEFDDSGFRILDSGIDQKHLPWTKMKLLKIFFLLIVCNLFTGHVHAQSITAFGGVNYGGFYSARPEEGHFNKDFDRGFGFFAGVEISELKLDSVWNFTIGIGIENYGGSFYLRDGGLGGYNYVRGELNKEVLFLSVSPISFRLFKHAYIRPGLCLNYELHKSIRGESYIHNMTMLQPIVNDLSTNENFTLPMNGGFLIQTGYSFAFQKFCIEPRYFFFLGLSKEMNISQAPTSSWRHGISIGLRIDK